MHININLPWFLIIQGVLITLKILGTIGWSWFVVLVPLWIILAFLVVFAILFIFVLKLSNK